MYSYRTEVQTNINMPVLFLDMFFFPEKYLKQPSIEFDFVDCRVSVTFFTRNAGDIDTSWLLIYFAILWAFYLFKLLIGKYM
jgi:hypothetical protein